MKVPFCAKPANYCKIDTHVSRSAQPQRDDFGWLKNQGVTDIVNFRTMYVSGNDFDEEALVKQNTMNYHQIPSITKQPTEENVFNFLNLVKKVRENKGKVHIHCKAGADRTGMYSYIYKTINGLGSMAENEVEWITRGHDYERYPNLISWARSFVLKILKMKSLR